MGLEIGYDCLTKTDVALKLVSIIFILTLESSLEAKSKSLRRLIWKLIISKKKS